MTTTKRTNWTRTSTMLGAVAVLLGGCGGGGSSLKPRVETRTLYGNVNGINNGPRGTNTQVTGRIKAQVSDTHSPVAFTLDFVRFNTNSSLSADITRVTVNIPSLLAVDPPATGSALFTLYEKPSGTGTPFPMTFSRTVSASDFTPAPNEGVKTYADAVNAIREGRTILQVYTTGFPQGEVRGFIGQDRLVAFLGRAQFETPPNSFARGSARVLVNAAQRKIYLTLTIDHPAGIQNVEGVEIHFGQAREEGTAAPVIFRVSGPFRVFDPIAGQPPTTLTKVLTKADFIPAPQRGLLTFDQLLEELPTLSFTSNGNQAFINVRTLQFPQGEIRGDIFQDIVAQLV